MFYLLFAIILVGVMYFFPYFFGSAKGINDYRTNMIISENCSGIKLDRFKLIDSKDNKLRGLTAGLFNSKKIFFTKQILRMNNKTIEYMVRHEVYHFKSFHLEMYALFTILHCTVLFFVERFFGITMSLIVLVVVSILFRIVDTTKYFENKAKEYGGSYA